MNTRSKSKSIQQKNKLREITTGFYKIFLESLQDKVVRNKLAYWYYQENKQKGQPSISEIIKTARQFQKEKDEDDSITLPDFKSDDISSYFENEKESESNIIPLNLKHSAEACTFCGHSHNSADEKECESNINPPKIIFLFNL